MQKKVPSLNSIETLWRCDAENKSLGHLKDEEGLTFKMYLLSDPTQMKLPLWVGKIWDVTKLTGHHFHSSFSSQLEFAKGWVLKSWQIFFANLACMSHLDKIMQPFDRFHQTKESDFKCRSSSYNHLPIFLPHFLKLKMNE